MSSFSEHLFQYIVSSPDITHHTLRRVFPDQLPYEEYDLPALTYSIVDIQPLKTRSNNRRPLSDVFVQFDCWDNDRDNIDILANAVFQHLIVWEDSDFIHISKFISGGTSRVEPIDIYRYRTDWCFKCELLL